MSVAESQEASLSLRKRLRQFNGTLVFIMIYMGGCAFNFGYDVGNFCGVQGMQSFGKRFGEYNSATGTWSLPAWLSSVMTSVPFMGKALGAISCGYIAERFGRRWAVIALAMLSFIGVLLQTTATTPAQFTLGRVISFGMTGMTIVVVPIYQSETAPRALRGMMNSTLQVMIIFGQLVASLVNLGTQHIPDDRGWRIPVSIQFVAPTLITIFWYLVPESPRWLLARNRAEDATKSLIRLRKKDTPAAEIEAEIEALRHANSNASKGSWKEVFNKENRIRTTVSVLAMFGQQITGQAFVSQYGVIFYQQQGFKSQAFLFTVISNVVALVCLFATWFFVDQVGRRPLLFLGGVGMGTFLYILGGIGTVAHPTTSEKNMLVASVQLFGASYGLSWAPISYIVMGEAASSRVKEKTSLFASVISILTTFVTSFTLPYLLNKPYADLGSKVGFVYGSFCWVMVIVAFLFIPELKGRSLEEVDQLFVSGKPLWKFGQIKTTPVGEIYYSDGKNDATVTEQVA